MRSEAGSSIESARQYSTLDAMRGIAALAVIILHEYDIARPLKAASAPLAVDLFYIISGFIVTHAYREKLCAGLGARPFMLIRLIRLYPLYLLGTIIGIFYYVPLYIGNAASHSANNTIAYIVSVLDGLFFAPQFRWGGPSLFSGQMLQDASFPLNLPAWSLFYELVVNLFFCVFLFRLRKLYLCALMAACFIYMVVSTLPDGGFNVEPQIAYMPMMIARATFSFAMGMLIYEFHSIRMKLPPLLTLVLCACVFCLDPSIQNRAATYAIVIFPVLPLLVWCGASVEPPPSLIRSFKCLGAISYTVYAIHYPLRWVFTSMLWAFNIDPGANAPWTALVFIAGLMIVSPWINRNFDAPVRAFLTRVFLQKPEPRAAAVDPIAAS